MKERLTTRTKWAPILVAGVIPTVVINGGALALSLQGETIPGWTPMASMLSLALAFATFSLREWAKGQDTYLVNALLAVWSAAVAVALININGPPLYVSIAMMAAAAAVAVRTTYEKWQSARKAIRQGQTESE